VSDMLDPAPLPEGLGIPAEEWQQTPRSVRLVVRTLLKRLDALEARLHQDSSNSSRPPSTDAPTTKRHRRMNAADRRKPGGKPGHPGHPQILLEPTATVSLEFIPIKWQVPTEPVNPVLRCKCRNLLFPMMSEA
jgi:Family of unknown function (DUF6444)